MITVNWIVDAALGQSRCGDPDAPALSLEGDRTWTYRTLHEKRNRYANGLAALGVKSGDRVGILMGNAPEYLGVYFAVARLGAISVRLNFRLTTRELRYVLADSGTSVLCVAREYMDLIVPIREELGLRGVVVFEQDEVDEARPWASPWTTLETAPATAPDVPEPAPSDVMMLMYTSGTTGSPKAAVWTHETTMGCANRIALEMRFHPGTVGMTVGPLYHAGAWETMLLSVLLCRGHGIVARSSDFDLARIVGVMRSQQVTDIVLYPFMIYELLAMEDVTGDTLPVLRKVMTGGDVIQPASARAFRRRLPGVDLIICFGLTEGPSVTFLHDSEFDEHTESIGRPCITTEIAVVDDRGDPVAPGETGEILMRGSGVVQEYWNKPEANAATFAGGWCHTGDLGRLSDDGYISIAGRKKDMIRSGGENIYPAEVEAVIADHPAVADVAVIAVPDSRWGEVGCAVLVAKTGPVDDGELRAFTRERLAAYKCPKHYVWATKLPRNASGKILKRVLRQDHGDRFATAPPAPR